MTLNVEKMRHDMKWEVRKFIVACVIAAVGLIGAGIGLANLFGWHH